METQNPKKDNISTINLNNYNENNNNNGTRSSIGLIDAKSISSNIKAKVASKQVKISNGADLVNNSNTNMQINLNTPSGSEEQDIFKVSYNYTQYF